MKLFAPILVGLTSGSTNGVRQIEMTRSMFDGSRVCGMMTGSGGHMTDNMTLRYREKSVLNIFYKNIFYDNYIYLFYLVKEKVVFSVLNQKKRTIRRFDLHLLKLLMSTALNFN